MPTPRRTQRADGRRISDLLTIDELINFVQAKARSRRGRRVIAVTCFLAALSVTIVPLVLRSGRPAPASIATVPIVTAVPSTTPVTDPLAEIVPLYTKSGSHRFGPPLTTTTVATTPRTTVAPVGASAPATFPPKLPPTGPPVTQAPTRTTQPPDSPVDVPYTP